MSDNRRKRRKRTKARGQARALRHQTAHCSHRTLDNRWDVLGRLGILANRMRSLNTLGFRTEGGGGERGSYGAHGTVTIVTGAPETGDGSTFPKPVSRIGQIFWSQPYVCLCKGVWHDCNCLPPPLLPIPSVHTTSGLTADWFLQYATTV